MSTFKDLYLGRWPEDFVFSREELGALARVLTAKEIEALNMLQYDCKANALRKDRPMDPDYSVEHIQALKTRAHKIIDAGK